MRECEDLNFTRHANISSKYVKFLAHNSQQEVVARIEKRTLEFEDVVKQFKKDEASKAKQLNITAQKVNSYASKLAAIETKLTRLEKK